MDWGYILLSLGIICAGVSLVKWGLDQKHPAYYIIGYNNKYPIGILGIGDNFFYDTEYLKSFTFKFWANRYLKVLVNRRKSRSMESKYEVIYLRDSTDLVSETSKIREESLRKHRECNGAFFGEEPKPEPILRKWRPATIPSGVKKGSLKRILSKDLPKKKRVSRSPAVKIISLADLKGKKLGVTKAGVLKLVS